MKTQWIWIISDRSVLVRYALAIGLSAVALGLNFLIQPFTERNLLFLSTASIILASIAGGYGPGAVATVLTTLGLNFWFLQALHDLRQGASEGVVRILVFAFTGVLMTLLGAALRRTLLRLQEARWAAEQAIKARDEFISVASHELKTPLSALRLRAQLGLRQLKNASGTGTVTPESHEKFLAFTDATSGRMQRLIEDMLDFSRITHGKLRVDMERVALEDVVSSVVDRFSGELRERSIELTVESEPGLTLMGDPHRLEQVLSNLVSNAIKYGNGAPISITAKSVASDAVSFCVEDRGPGIAEEHRETVFERFERITPSKNAGGMGLGLYICRRIIELHGGRIWVESGPGKGARFCVQVPKGLSS